MIFKNTEGTIPKTFENKKFWEYNIREELILEEEAYDGYFTSPLCQSTFA